MSGHRAPVGHAAQARHGRRGRGIERRPAECILADIDFASRAAPAEQTVRAEVGEPTAMWLARVLEFGGTRNPKSVQPGSSQSTRLALNPAAARSISVAPRNVCVVSNLHDQSI